LSGVIDAHGPVAAAERLILINATAIMLVVVLPVIVLTLAFAWWYRAGNSRATYRPDWAYSGNIELVVWSIPAMIVLLLAGVGWISSHALDPAVPLHAADKPLRIEAVSLDWKWLFIYPDQHVAAINELVVPAGVPLQFTLTSGSVMNAFFIPQLGSQIYTMAGMSTRLNLLATDSGTYAGFSSQFSGDGFSDMRFMVHAVPYADFQAWLARLRAGPTLDQRSYLQLAQTHAPGMPRSYGSVEPGLFERIQQWTTQPEAAPSKDP
jgi:cytochrome o ubiquinol oxidase subunit 2